MLHWPWMKVKILQNGTKLPWAVFQCNKTTNFIKFHSKRCMTVGEEVFTFSSPWGTEGLGHLDRSQTVKVWSYYHHDPLTEICQKTVECLPVFKAFDKTCPSAVISLDSTRFFLEHEDVHFESLDHYMRQNPHQLRRAKENKFNRFCF